MLARVELLDERRNVVSSSLTDESGVFKFDSIEPGKYLIRAQALSGDSDIFAIRVEFAKNLSSDCELVLVIGPKTGMACGSNGYKDKKDFKKYAKEPRKVNAQAH
jgi:hypothetical protein